MLVISEDLGSLVGAPSKVESGPNPSPPPAWGISHDCWIRAKIVPRRGRLQDMHEGCETVGLEAKTSLAFGKTLSQ